MTSALRGPLPFVGRGLELAALTARLAEARQGHGSLALIAGDPGIGKTRLVEEFARAAEAGGAQVLWGRCYEGDGAPAFWPWVQLLRAYLRVADHAAIASHLGAGAAVIAQLVPDVAQVLPGLAAPPVLTADAARFRLFDAVTTFLCTAARAQPLVLILDDLHWADAASLLLLQFLGQEIPRSSLLVVGTYRDGEVRRGDALAHTLAHLARIPASASLSLAGLTEQDIARIIQDLVGHAPAPTLVTAVYRETEGNPFFTTEMMRLLATEDRVAWPETAPGWELSLPQSVRQVINLRLDHLSAACNRMLAIAAVIGREFSLAVLERVSPVPGARLLELLAEAATARVITAVPGALGRYRFAHALIRDVLEEDLTLAVRAGLHRRVGDALEAAYGSDVEPHLAELAHHFLQAAPGGDVDRAVRYATQAAARATRLLAYEEAVRHYLLALQVHELTGAADAEWQCAVLLELGEAQNRAGDRAGAQATFRRAADLARQLRAPVHLARAALGYGGVVLTGGTVDTTLLGLLEEALAALEPSDSPLRARVMARLAQELYFADGTDARPHRSALSAAAVAMARRTSDRPTLAAALFSRHMAVWDPHNLEERLTAATEILQLAQEAGDWELALQGYRWRLPDLLEAGDIVAAEQDRQAHARLAQEMRQPLYRWDAQRWQAMHALLTGQFAEAERLIDAVYDLGQTVLSGTAYIYFVVQRYTLRWEQGRLGEMEATVGEFVARYPAMPIWRAWLAHLHSELGQWDAARREFDQLATADFGGLTQDIVWLAGVSLLAEVCAALHDRERAAVLYDLLQPYRPRIAVAGSAVVCYGSVARALGLLAATLDRGDEARCHFEAALAANAALGARPLLARTQYDTATLLLRGDVRQGHDQAVVLLTQARATAAALGMTRLMEQAETLQTVALARRSDRAAYPHGLTEREVEVLRLLAGGRTNRAIADALVLSVRTVESHRASIYGKTGTRSRAELTAYAFAHGVIAAPPPGR